MSGIRILNFKGKELGELWERIASSRPGIHKISEKVALKTGNSEKWVEREQSLYANPDVETAFSAFKELKYGEGDCKPYWWKGRVSR